MTSNTTTIIDPINTATGHLVVTQDVAMAFWAYVAQEVMVTTDPVEAAAEVAKHIELQKAGDAWPLWITASAGIDGLPASFRWDGGFTANRWVTITRLTSGRWAVEWDSATGKASWFLGWSWARAQGLTRRQFDLLTA